MSDPAAADLRLTDRSSRGIATAPSVRAVIVRPLTPDDERLYPDFLAQVTSDDRRLRFFSPAPLTAGQIWAFTHFDPRCAVALVAAGLDDGRLCGVARLHAIGDREGEFAVLVRSDLKGQRLGQLLMGRLLSAAPSIGVDSVVGLILRDNVGMLALAGDLGFTLTPAPDDAGLVDARLDLRRPAARSRAA